MYSGHQYAAVKYGLNPETFQLTEEPKTIDPLEIDLDDSAYGKLPSLP